MPIKQEIIAQIDRALRFYEDYRKRAKYDDLSDLGEDVHEEVATIVAATLRRLAPDN